MENIVASLSKYTGLSVDELTEAFEAVQEEHRDAIEDLFWQNVTVGEGVDDRQWEIDPGNFFEALFDDYIIEER